MTQKRTSRSVNTRDRGTPVMVRRSTLYVSVVAALLFGLFMGTLIPSFSEQTPVSQGSGGQGSGGQGSSEESSHIADAEAATVANPQDADAWIHLGNLYYGAQQAEKSVMAYTKALEIAPRNANVLTDRGTMYRKMGKFDLALASYEQARKVDPRHENSLFNAGIVLYFDLGRKAEAREKWQQLVRLNPSAKAPNGQSVKDMLLDMQ